MKRDINKVHKELEKYRNKCAKRESIGKRETINGVNCIIHTPDTDKKNLPCVLIAHGGAFIGGDAVEIDSLAQKICKNSPALCVNVNYTKLDVKPLPYPMEEILSLINYFKENCSNYNINPDNIIIMGTSAGANIMACTAISALRKNIKINREILVYPYLDWTGTLYDPLIDWGIYGIPLEEWKKVFFENLPYDTDYLSPYIINKEKLISLAETDIIICGIDELKPHGLEYYKKLKEIGVKTSIKEYEKALHGFLEINRDDYYTVTENKNPEQREYAIQCEDYIIDLIKQTIDK